MMSHITNDCGIAEEYLFFSRLLLFIVSGYSMCSHSMCSSTAFLCLNLSQEQCTTVALTIGIMGLVTSIISTSLLLCLLLVFKIKAWNSPIKRLTLMIATCFGLLEFVDASLELYNNILQRRTWLEVFFLLTYYTVFAILLYLIVILAIPFFQIGVAIVPGEWKHKVKSRLHLLEVAIHILIPILSLSFSGVIAVYKRDDNCSPWIAVKKHYIVCYLVNLLSLFGIILLLLYFHRKYSTTRGITRRAKWLLLHEVLSIACTSTH